MFKGLDSVSQKFLLDMERIQRRSERAQAQLSSGLRVSKPSDAPEDILHILRLRSEVQQNQQVQTNLGRVTAEVNTAEGAVRQAVLLVERVQVLAAQSAGSSADVDRKFLGVEARQILEQLVGLTRTTSEGRLVFSGDSDQSVLYEMDTADPDAGVTRLAIATNTRVVEDAQGIRFSVARSSHDIFDARNADDTPAAQNVFETVYQLTLALEANDPEAVQDTLPSFDAALEHLNLQLTFYGQTQNRVKTAIDGSKAKNIELVQKLSALEDTDPVAAILELNLAQVHQETALASHAKRPRSSLFDYLG